MQKDIDVLMVRISSLLRGGGGVSFFPSCFSFLLHPRYLALKPCPARSFWKGWSRFVKSIGAVKRVEVTATFECFHLYFLLQVKAKNERWLKDTQEFLSRVSHTWSAHCINDFFFPQDSWSFLIFPILWPVSVLYWVCWWVYNTRSCAVYGRHVLILFLIFKPDWTDCHLMKIPLTNCIFSGLWTVWCFMHWVAKQTCTVV